MSKRNLILLIIVLFVAVFTFFGFLYFNQPKNGNTTSTTGTNFIAQFNPFSNKNTTPTKPPVNISGYQQNTVPAVKLQLTKVSSMPIAGYTVFQKERLKIVPTDTTSNTNTTTNTTTTKPLTEFIPNIRYIAKENGNIYQTFADTIDEKQFSNTIIPKVYDAYFGNNGLSVIMRYLEGDNQTIDTFLGNTPKEYLGTNANTVNQIKGNFLPVNIKDISLSFDNQNAFYLFNSNDNIIGTTINLATNKKVQIFVSPFTEWLSSYINNKNILLTTKPSYNVPGSAFNLDLTNSSLTKVIDGVNGLTTLPGPDGKSILYADNNLSLSIFHTDTRTSTIVGVRTLPEKCVWNKKGDTIYCAVPKFIAPLQYPDTWYQGETSFSDQIWKINVATGNTILLMDPIATLGGEDVDGVKLMLDDNENYLFFMNKKDSFLWELNLLGL